MDIIFLQFQDEWPQRLTSENSLDLSKDKEILGNKAKIEEELKQATRTLFFHIL